MKKFAFLLLFCILAIIAAYLVANYDELIPSEGKRQLITKLTPLKCDLNKQTCEYDFKGKKVGVTFSPLPVPILEEIDLKLSNLGTYKALSAKVYGLNMYMGTLVPSFEKIGNTYTAKLFLSSCVLEVMRYRFEFFDGEKPIGFSFDIDVRR